MPLTNSALVLGATGLTGREWGPPGVIGTAFRLGVVTPVFWPVVVPSFRGNCTFRVSRYSSGTHSSSRLLTARGIRKINKSSGRAQVGGWLVDWYCPEDQQILGIHTVYVVDVEGAVGGVLLDAQNLGQWPVIGPVHPHRQPTTLGQRCLEAKSERA